MERAFPEDGVFGAPGCRLTRALRIELAAAIGLLCFWGGAADLAGQVPSRAPGDNDPRLEPAPFIRVENTGSDPAFSWAADATLLPGNRLVIADLTASELVFLDAAGRPVRRAGREGQGPGEYKLLYWLEQCGSRSLFAWDPSLARVAVLNDQGKFLRQFRPPGNPARLACTRQGSLLAVMRTRSLQRPSSESPVHTAPVTIANSNGDSIGSLGEMRVGVNRPLGTIAQFAMSDDAVFFGPADSAIVHVFDHGGRWQRTIPVGKAGRVSTQRHYAAAVEHLIANRTSRDEKDLLRRQLLAIPRPTALPAYFGLHVDPQGWLWAVTSPPGEGVTVLEGKRPDGTAAGELRLPVELHVFEVGSDYVLGVETVGSGEQHVLAWRFHRQ